jgi:hypothetical protein
MDLDDGCAGGNRRRSRPRYRGATFHSSPLSSSVTM